MTNVVAGVIEKHPKLLVLLANTAVGKIIHLIDSGVIGPIFNREKTIQEVQSWPKSVKMSVEWMLYLLGGAIRTMPDKKNPVAIMMQEALVETITHTGMKIADIPEAEQTEIMVSALPLMRRELSEKIANDRKFRDLLGSILGTTQEWNNALQSANGFLSQKSEEIETHRQTRKTRGWRRLL